jgi:hypothetical protein
MQLAHMDDVADTASKQLEVQPQLCERRWLGASLCTSIVYGPSNELSSFNGVKVSRRIQQYDIDSFGLGVVFVPSMSTLARSIQRQAMLDEFPSV